MSTHAIPAQVVHPTTTHHTHLPDADHNPPHHSVATHTHGCPDDHMLALHRRARLHTMNVLDILLRQGIDPVSDSAGSAVGRNLDMGLEVAVVGGRVMSPGKLEDSASRK